MIHRAFVDNGGRAFCLRCYRKLIAGTHGGWPSGGRKRMPSLIFGTYSDLRARVAKMSFCSCAPHDDGARFDPG